MTRAGTRRTRTRTHAGLALAAVAVAVVAAGCGRSSSGGGPTPTTVGSSTVAPAGYGAPVILGQIADEAVTESSGLVASRRNPGRLWTHNDSDNPPILFCVEPDGGSCGPWTVVGAKNVDWEDIAAGPGPDPGEDYLYVGDIGDNDKSRDDVVVYRVVEPTVPARTATPGEATGGVTAPATAIRLRYDDGPHNAESLMVQPTTGDFYVVIKDAGDAGVYKAPPDGGVLTRIATLDLGLLGLATGADISPDGRRAAVCTPFGGFELSVDPGAEFDTIWSRPLSAVTLPARAQGEAIAYRLDGNALLVTSEGYPSPLVEVARL